MLFNYISSWKFHITFIIYIDKGDKGDKGDDGRSFIIKAMFETLDDLKKAHPTGEIGDVYCVGTSLESYIYIWDVDDSRWENVGRIQGDPGKDGKDGKSAYDIAVENGFVGSENDWIESLQGQEFYVDDDMNLKLKLGNGTEVTVGKIINDDGEIAVSAVDQTARTTSKAAVGVASVGLVYNLISLIYILIKRKKHI